MYISKNIELTSFLWYQFISDSFQPRNRVTHANHCSSLHGDLHDHYATTYGIKRDSTLNTSKFFHVTEGLVPDVMHDCLEGCLPYEMKELLRHLFQCGTITLPALNEIIQTFPYQASDTRNKPSTISSSTMSSSDHALKQTGNFVKCVSLYNVSIQVHYIYSNTNVVSGLFASTDDRS